MTKIKVIIFLLAVFLSAKAFSQEDEEKVTKLDKMPGLTEKLKNKIETIREESKEEAENHKEKEKKLKKDLNKLMESYPADLAAIEAKIRAIEKEDTAQEIINAKKHQKIRKLLSTEQRQYYDEFIMLDKKTKK